MFARIRSGMGPLAIRTRRRQGWFIAPKAVVPRGARRLTSRWTRRGRPPSDGVAGLVTTVKGLVERFGKDEAKQLIDAL